MKKMLFVTEKWCDGAPQKGLTNSFHNLFNTFDRDVTNFSRENLFCDESFYKGRHIDGVLLDYVDENKIKFVFCSFLGQSHVNPSAKCLQELKKKGVFIIFNWPDSNPEDLIIRDSLYDVSDLNVIWDLPESPLHNLREKKEKDVFLWAPQDENLFYPCEQDIPVSFVGSKIYRDRVYFLTELEKRISIFVSGGQREQGLSPQKYAEAIRRSKININFSLSSNRSEFHQLKGRVMEVLSSGSLLLEPKGSPARKLFNPGEDYVEFNGVEDLAEKILFYLKNPKERAMIADSGHRKYKQNFLSKSFWEAIIAYTSKYDIRHL